MKFFCIAAALVTAAACGGSSDPTQLDSGFNGTWSGPATLTISGQSPLSGMGHLVIAVAGQTATVSGVCPDNSGSIIARGSGRSATWGGNLPCPPVVFTNCSSVTMTFQSATLTLNGTALSAQGSGTAIGCGITTTFSETLTGNKT